MFKVLNVDKKSESKYGFKIHLSATKENYKELFHLVYPLLIEKDIVFKYIEKDEDVLFNFSENESPAESGKYFTIYPNSHAHFLELLEFLYQSIPREMDGIYILSDRAYKDSKVIFYRYGFFEDTINHISNGLPTLTGPNGEIWKDYQKAYFDLPSWISDIQESTIIQDSYLSSNYKVTALLRKNNGGNVYKAIQLESHREVIIKEARPHIIVLDNVDKKMMRDNEFYYATKLENLGHTPAPVEQVKEWINHYYIYQSIRGEDLIDDMNRYSLFSFDSTHSENNMKKFEVFLAKTHQLLQLVESFHQQGIVLNDIHANNIRVAEDGTFYFIDLENAYDFVEGSSVGIYNEISLKEWNVLNGYVADCHKLGNLLLFLLGRLQLKSGESYQPKLVHELLQRYGIDTNFSEFIQYLFSNNATIRTALDLCTDLFIKPYRASYSIDKNSVVLNNQELDFMYFLNNNLLKKYKNCHDDRYLKVLIDREKNLGLDGLSGVFMLINEGEIQSDLSTYIIEKIENSIVVTEYGESISFGENHASPYLDNGTAGFIRALLLTGKTEYFHLIHRLTDALLVEFAQHSNYRGGMLGVTDVLIDLYKLFREERILQTIEKQLVIVGIKSNYYSFLQNELTYVISRYRSIKDEIIFTK